jgi:predicted RNase H-like nuclease (RuvC/YqgF family)
MERCEQEKQYQEQHKNPEVSVDGEEGTLADANEKIRALGKQVDAFKEQTNHQEAQIRRLHSNIADLRVELSRVKGGRLKEKELLSHRRNEIIKLIQLFSRILKIVKAVNSELILLPTIVLDSLLYTAHKLEK